MHGLNVYFQDLSAFFDRQFQFQTPFVCAYSLGYSKGTDWGFVAVGVSETAGGKGIVTQIVDHAGVVIPGRIHFITLPPAQGDRANLQSGSGFRLVDLELAPSLSEVASDCDWLLGNGDSAVVCR